MHRQTNQSLAKDSLDNFLPKESEIISSLGLVLTPVNYAIVNGEQRWTTYAVLDETSKIWNLCWSPYKGLAVFIHKKNFQELQNFPYVQKLKVIKRLKRAVVAEIYE